MLAVESEFWCGTDNSRTAKTIENFTVAIDVLIVFIEEKNFVGFLFTFFEYNITVPEIRACFRANSERQVKAQRNRAHRLLMTVFQKMLALLKIEGIRAKMATFQGPVNIAEAEKFCSQNLEEARRAVEKEDPFDSLFS
eukprot:m.248311 g.248311  ORF g.248311 m.248311 type:complete len:139 (+) comp58218_c0_seq1:104-520(+)